MSTELLERLRQEVADAMAAEVTAATEAAQAHQRQRIARKEITIRTKRLREAEADERARAQFTSPKKPESFF